MNARRQSPREACDGLVNLGGPHPRGRDVIVVEE
jgi:hypothetical protein